MRGEVCSVTTEVDEDQDLWVEVDYQFHTPAGVLVRPQVRLTGADLVVS